MVSRNLSVIQKAGFLILIQITLIFLSYTLFSIISNEFQQTKQLKLQCMKISDLQDLCISTFQRNSSIIPQKKAIIVQSLHRNSFKLLSFQQSPTNLSSTYKNIYKEYFYLINSQKELKSAQDLELDVQVQQINNFLKIQKASLSIQTFKKTVQNHRYQFFVIYFLQQNLGPKDPQPQAKVTYSTYHSIYLTNKLYLFECLIGIAILIIWAYHPNTKFQVRKIFENPETKKIVRPIFFYASFWIVNLLFYLTLQNYWPSLGINSINKTFASYILKICANSSESFIGLFPEWLLLGYFIFLVFKKCLNQQLFVLFVISGIIDSLILMLFSQMQQFMVEILTVLAGIFIISSMRTFNDSQLTIPIVYTGLSLGLMILVKVMWWRDSNQSNDFMMRFIYGEIFLISNLMPIFFNNQQIIIKQKNIYIPYEEYQLEQNPDFQESLSISNPQTVS